MIGLTKKFTAMNVPVYLLEQLKALKKANLVCYGKSVSYEEMIGSLIRGLRQTDPKLYEYFKRILEVESPQSLESETIDVQAVGRFSLHEAIAEVLRQAGRPLTTAEIAEAINRSKIYMRGDGVPVPSAQISARISHYPSLFSINRATSPKTICLRNNNSDTMRKSRLYVTMWQSYLSEILSVINDGEGDVNVSTSMLEQAGNRQYYGFKMKIDDGGIRYNGGSAVYRDLQYVLESYEGFKDLTQGKYIILSFRKSDDIYHTLNINVISKEG